MGGEERGTPRAAARPVRVYDIDAVRRIPGGIASRGATFLGAADATTASEVTTPAGRGPPDGRG